MRYSPELNFLSCNISMMNKNLTGSDRTDLNYAVSTHYTQLNLDRVYSKQRMYASIHKGRHYD